MNKTLNPYVKKISDVRQPRKERALESLWATKEEKEDKR
jgi:hypothetical protein